MWLDARIPVRLVPPDTLADALRAQPDAALLVEDGIAVPGGRPAQRFLPLPPHQAGCACCGARSAAAHALDRLFLDRARGTGPMAPVVLAAVATEAGRAALAAALASDPVVPMRYRLVD
jgi:hypothetical protein